MPSDTVPKPASGFESAAISTTNTEDNSYLEFLRKDTGASRIVQVSDGGAFGGSYLFTLADAVLTVEFFEEGGHLEESKRLGAEVATAAWAKIGRLNILSWRRRYVPEDITPGMIIFDGTQWSVIFCDKAKGAYSSGNNVYPALSPLGAPTLDAPPTSNAYRELLSLFMNLAATSRLLPERNVTHN